MEKTVSCRSPSCSGAARPPGPSCGPGRPPPAPASRTRSGGPSAGSAAGGGARRWGPCEPCGRHPAGRARTGGAWRAVSPTAGFAALGLNAGPSHRIHHLLGELEPPGTRPGRRRSVPPPPGGASRPRPACRATSSGVQHLGAAAGDDVGQQVEIAGPPELVAVPGQLGPQGGAPARVEQEAEGAEVGSDPAHGHPALVHPLQGSVRRSVPFRHPAADCAHSGRGPIARWRASTVPVRPMLVVAAPHPGR